MQDKKAEKDFFDRFDKEGGYDVFDLSGYCRMISWMTDLIPPKKGQAIFDMGCGSGAFTSYLYRAYPGCQIVGIDISPGCIKRAKKNFSNVDFRIDDIEDLKIESSSADVLCYSGILHHFGNFEKAAKEAYRILKPGGRFFSYDPNYSNPAFWLYRAKSSPFYSQVGVTVNERLLKAKEVDHVFSKAGFMTKVQIKSGISFCCIEGKQAKSILKIYNILDRILGASPFSRFIGAWVIGYGIKV